MPVPRIAKGVLILALLVSAAFAQGPVKLEGWTYRTDNGTLSDEWADKTGKALCDGDRTRKGTAIYSGGTITIDIDLGKPARVTSVVAHASRPNNNYKLRTFTVLAKSLGHYRPAGSVEGFWGATQQRDFRLEVKGLDVTTDSLRLVFNTASILCLAEVEIHGEPSGAAAATEVRLAPVNDARPSAREADVDGDGKPEVVLENSLVRLIFWPSAGGVCRSFLYKPAGAELVASTNPRYGLLRDQLWSPSYAFADRPYEARTGGDANSAWVELSTSGAGGMMNFTRISKRIRIDRDSPVARVHYRLLNDPSSQTEYLYGLWFHHFAGVPGGENRYFDPTEEGVREFRFMPGEKGSEVWHRSPARGWSAVLGAKGAGLAMAMDYKYLNCFYHWSGVGVPVATHEWRFNRIPLKSGEALETDLALIPFQGLDRVDGVVEDVIGAVSLEPAEGDPAAAVVKLQLASPRSKPAAGLLRLRRLPDGPWQGQGRLEVAAGKPAEKRLDLSGLAPGAYVINCSVQRGTAMLDDFERAFTRGGARLAYTRPAKEKRVGLAAEERPALPRHDLSDAVATPHVPWARPLPGGPIKAVVLCDDTMAREVIELKQRLDLDPTYVKFRTTLWKEDLWCGDRSISTPEQANRRLLEHLKASRYELLILAGFHWNTHFTPEVRDAITAQVREGAGILFIMPDGFKADDPLAPMMGISGTRGMQAWARWKCDEVDSPLTAGLPWDHFPQTRFMEYQRPPEGEVLARLDTGDPLLVTNQLGKGRTVALTYDVLTHDMSYRGYAGLTPILSYRGGFLRPEFKEMTWNYWEPWYALLARLSAWAAGRDTGVRLAALEPPAAGAKALSLKLEGGQGEYRVEAQLRNRRSHPAQRVEATYRPGQAEVSIPLPEHLGAGLNPVDVIVRDAAGRSVAWGQTYVRATAPLAIKSVQPEKEIAFGVRAPRAGQPYHHAFQPGEPFRVTVALEGTGAAGSRVRARLYDTHRRLLFEETRPVPAGAAEMAFEARPAELRSMGLEWEAATLGPEGQTDVAYAKVVCRWPRDWDRFRLSSWNGLFPWRSEYLYPSLAPLVEDLVDVAFYGTNELNTGHVWRHFWHNMDWCFLGLLSYMGKDVPDFVDAKFAEKAARYNETRSKEWLVREPSLSDAEWRAKVAEHMKAQAALAMRFGGAYDYCMGDEMSLTHYTRYFDFDWSPHALGAFREWLQARYPNLDALNGAWETTFASWDAVVPMTLEEVKGRANAAPWCEFRDFMNDSIADLFALVQASLKSVDPQARAGLSGTQEPRSGNGMDWWKNSKAFNYYHAYNTGWSNEMRRSFAPYTGVAQTPYYAGYWQSGRAIEYNMFWCLLHDTEAVSAWTTPIFFYNDFTHSESGRDTLALCQEMRHGLWDLIRGARRAHDGIAIHYSHSSINAATLLGKDEEIVRHRDAWVKLIEDLGLQYDFIATPQIEEGILARGDAAGDRYRVLILPESFAVSDKEKAAIEAFVRTGGTVVADRGAGVMDGKCRKGAKGGPPFPPQVGGGGGAVLDDLFGIRRGEGGGEGAVGIQVRMPGAPPAEVKLPVAEALTATTAKAMGQSTGEKPLPVLLRNAVGSGAAWYLNLDLSPFDNERVFHTPAEKGFRAVVGALLAEAGVKPKVAVTLASGNAPHVEAVRYTAGDLTYVGLLNARGGDEELATITFPEAGYVYDCRKGEALGKTGQVRASFAGGQARVYCLAPKPLAEPALALATAAAAPGGAVGYSVSLKGGSDRQTQLVRVTVTRPDGSECPDYARNLLLGGKGFTGEFRLALNDTAGTWKVVARDLCTGAQSTATFAVK